MANTGDTPDAPSGAASRAPLARAFRILRWMLDHDAPDWGVREVAQSLSMAPSAVHRSFTLLEQEGVLQRTSDSGRYALGLEFLRMARQAVNNYPVARTALPLMQSLTERTNETTLLMVYSHQQMEMFVGACVDSAHPVRYVQDLQGWMPIHAGATGLATLAFLPADERAQVIEKKGLPALTQNTVAEPEELDQVLKKIRENGYAVSREQRTIGAAAVAAPLVDSKRLVGDIALTIPVFRFQEERVPELAEEVVHCSREISKALGGSGDHPCELVRG